MLEKILKSYLEHICGTDAVQENLPLSKRTTFKIGGPARFFVTVRTKQTLVKLISALNYIEYPYRIIGAGSNLLVSDRGFNGVIIKNAFREIVQNGNFIYADAGASLAALAKFARDRNLRGLEFAATIPGTIGGAIYMNAGAHGSSISDIVAMVDVLETSGEMISPAIISLDARACKFAYRKSLFMRRRDLIITGAYFFLSPGNPAQIAALENQYRDHRRQTQPREPSAGSVFRNPNISNQRSPFNKGGVAQRAAAVFDDEVVPAAKLIDQLGLKGTRIGDAAISEKHANFIVNMGTATASDVKKLIRLVKKRVRDAHRIVLKAEIEFLGD